MRVPTSRLAITIYFATLVVLYHWSAAGPRETEIFVGTMPLKPEPLELREVPFDNASATDASGAAGEVGVPDCTIGPMAGLRNPVYELRPRNGIEIRVRDPAVHLTGTEGVHHEMFFTLYAGEPKKMWSDTSGYTVSAVRTADWHSFSEPEPVTPTGFCSPDAPVRWKGQVILAYQAYPDKALGGPVSGLFFSVRLAARKVDEPARWGPPTPFLEEALTLPWNTIGRTIDPTLFVGPDGKLHCFFIGSQWLPPHADEGKGPRRKSKANLLGHAVTDDPELRRWEILTRERPLLGVSERAADGVENVAVFKRRDGRFQMIYSEGLVAQHLAYATSSDLYTWEDGGPLQLDLGQHSWLEGRYGAPFVWRERASGCFMMSLMGEYSMKSAYHRSAIGLLSSTDGVRWQLLPPNDGHAEERLGQGGRPRTLTDLLREGTGSAGETKEGKPKAARPRPRPVAGAGRGPSPHDTHGGA